MTSDTTNVIEFQLDNDEAIEEIIVVRDALEDIKKITGEIRIAFSKLIIPIQNILKTVQTGVSEIHIACEKLTESIKMMNTVNDNMQNSGNMLTDIEGGYQAMLALCDGIERTEGASGKLYNIFADIATAPDLSGLFSSLFPNTTELIDILFPMLQTVFGVMTGMGGKIGTILSGLAGKIGGAFSSVATWVTGTLVPAISGALTAIASALGISVGWVVAIIAAVIAAIVAVIVYWDEIKLFFAETLPQIWTQFIEWLGGIFSSVTEMLSGAAQWIYDTVIQPIVDYFTPMVEWFSQLFQSIWQFLEDLCYNIVAFITGSVQLIFAILLTIGTWIYLNVIEPVAAFFADLWADIAAWAAEAWDSIVEIFTVVANWINENVIQPVVRYFSDMWDSICQFATDAWNWIVEVFQGVAAWFDKYVVQPVNEIVSKIADGFKNMVNGVIGFINGMIAGIIRGINGVIEALNKLKFTVPDWVPGLGGQTLGFNLKTLTAPQIPYLAKGAVLPANKPFMAVVGDQRHGTNIEAPLTTIQEAVAGVMDNHIAAMMAGFNALLQEQIALRHTVESIELGDNTIAEAVERYHEKMSIVYGYGAG